MRNDVVQLGRDPCPFVADRELGVGVLLLLELACAGLSAMILVGLFFAQFGVRHERGIPVVDQMLRTSHPRVYAAGDCIFRSGMTDAMVVVAAQQGKDVAANIDRSLRGVAA